VPLVDKIGRVGLMLGKQESTLRPNMLTHILENLNTGSNRMHDHQIKLRSRAIGQFFFFFCL
jgi:hypothetical protein